MIRETESFLPLDRDRLEELRVLRPTKPESIPIPDYKLFVATLEGPNRVGKTSIFLSVLDVVQAAHYLTYQEDELMPPVVGVREPPNLLVGPYGDTFRSLAKERKSKNPLITQEMLGDRVFQAKIFLWGRRMVEEEAFISLPLRQRGFLIGGPKCWSYPRRYHKGGQQVESPEDLVAVGRATLVKDRGTLSTWIFQGGQDKGGEVERIILDAYAQHVLMRENLTVVVLPPKSIVLDSNRVRGEGTEHDQFEGAVDESSYTRAHEISPFFSDLLVYVENDPTGAKNTLSAAAMVVGTLVVAGEQCQVKGLKLETNKEYAVVFPFGKLLELLNFYSFYLSSKFQEQAMDFLYGQPLVTGNVRIQLIDYKSVSLFIEPT